MTPLLFIIVYLRTYFVKAYLRTYLASRTAVEKLATIMVTEEVLNLKSNEICTVCQQGFMIGQELSQLPLNHMYHNDCVLTCLGHQNTRGYDLPMDTQEVPQANSLGGGG